MANENTVAAPPSEASTDQRNPKSVAANIMQGIQNKSNGRTLDVPGADKQAEQVIDPNAGKRKYTVNGKDVWLSTSEADAYVQKGIAFEPKVTQLGHLQNEMGAFLQTLTSDPLKILTDKRIGHTPKAVLEKVLSLDNIGDDVKEFLGEWYFKNVVEPMKLSPEERRMREVEKENQTFKDREAAAKDMAIKQENQRRVEMALNQIKANISEAMKESGLPTNDSPLGAFMARRTADIMRLGYFQRQAVTPKDAIERVKHEMKQVQTLLYDHLDPEALVKELGEKNADKVKKFFLKLVKDSEKQIPSNQKTHSTPRGERKVITPDDMHDYLDDLKKKG